MKNDLNPWDTQMQSKETVYPYQTNGNNSSGTSSNFLDIDFRRILRMWPFILLFALLGGIAAKVVLRYMVPIYRASSNVNIQQKEEFSLGQSLFGTRDPFNDKLAWFSSPTIAKEVVDNLNLRFVAVQKGVFKNKDLYGVIKWRISSTDTSLQASKLNFTIVPDAKGFRLIQGKSQIRGFWDKQIFVGNVPVLIEKYGDVSLEDEIVFTANDPWEYAFQITRNLQISSVKESNIIEVSFSDLSPKRAIHVLNGIIEVYNGFMILEKERSFSNAISFIDSRLAPLNQELNNIETENSIFKSRKGFTGVGSNGDLYQQKMLDLEKQLADIRLQRQTIQATENYLKNPESKDENMSLIGITDAYLQSLLIQFQKLRADRISLAYRVTDNNDDLKELDKQINSIKENIILQVGNFKKAIQLKENNYQSLLQDSKNLLSSTPMDEKILIDQERQQNIKEQMFLILLQKREEASIAKASVTSDTKVLKPAILPTEPVSPDSNKILISFIFGAALLPLMFILVVELVNRKIVSRNQLERISDLPILADLEFDKEASENIVLMDKGSRTMFHEQIRSLRANLIFYRKPNQPLVILITSSMSGEGKSFISTNLARSFSMLGEKTALVEMDLRRPNIAKRLNIPNVNGLSKVFGGHLDPEKIKVPIIDSEKFDLYPSGTIPPNPSELISSEHAEKFMKYLQANYDIIIVDTPPFGLVSDAQLIAKWCNITLVITRFNKTLIEHVKNIQRWNQQKLFPSMALVLNAIQTTGYYGYNYGYYYYMKKKGYDYYTPSSVKSDENQVNES